jgi:hypothetical protein
VEGVLFAVAVLACPVGMLLMGWFMARGMRNSKQEESSSVDDLRAEHRRLGAEIERLEGADGKGESVPAGKP